MGLGSGSGGGSISGSSDVILNNAANNQSLLYDASVSKWKNAAIPSLALGTTSTTAKAGNWVPGMADLPAGVPYFLLRTSTIPNPARPSVQIGTTVAWVDTVTGLSQPTNWANNDIWIQADTVVEPVATQTFGATAEGNTDGATVTSSNSPFTYVDVGGGTNTQTYTTTSPVAGSVSYRISQAASGSQNNLGVNNVTTQDQWAVTLLFSYESMPTQTGGSALMKAYNDNAWTATQSTFTVYCTSTGNLFINTGLGAAQGKILETGIGVITQNTKYRLRLQGQVTNNLIRMIVDTGVNSTVLYDSGLVAPSGSNHEIGLFSAVRWGTGTSGPTGPVVVRGELYIGTGPGLLAIG